MLSIAFANFQFDNSIFPYHDAIVPNDHGILVRHGKPRLAQLVHQCVFIDLLKESGSQRVEHRQGAANDSFGQEANPVRAGIHLRVLRALRFHFPCLLPARRFQFVDPSSAAKAWIASLPAMTRVSCRTIQRQDFRPL
jgi:hypothetical protein